MRGKREWVNERVCKWTGVDVVGGSYEMSGVSHEKCNKKSWNQSLFFSSRFSLSFMTGYYLNIYWTTALLCLSFLNLLSVPKSSEWRRTWVFRRFLSLQGWRGKFLVKRRGDCLSLTAQNHHLLWYRLDFPWSRRRMTIMMIASGIICSNYNHLSEQKEGMEILWYSWWHIIFCTVLFIPLHNKLHQDMIPGKTETQEEWDLWPIRGWRSPRCN